jgi:HTH-type transcriptional regulator / antitoxin HigA
MKNLKIILIKDVHDYHDALEAIGLLMTRPDRTPEEEEYLEAMAIFVEKWESENKLELLPPTPLEAIAFVMEQRNLQNRDMVPFIGSASKVNNVLSGKRPLTAVMIQALHEGLGIPYQILHASQHTSKTALLEQVYENASTKYSKIINRFFGNGDPKASLEECVERLGGEGSLPCGALSRKNDENRTSAKTDRIAYLIWMLKILDTFRTAQESEATPPYVKKIDASFLHEIATLSIHPDGPIRAIKALREKGIFACALAHPPKTYLDGATFVYQKTPIIGITLRYDRVDNFWFTLLHELAHVVNDYDAMCEGSIFIDDLTIDRKTGLSDCEERADALAKESLIPEEWWKKIQAQPTLTSTNVYDYSQHIGVHPFVIAGRIRYERQNYRLFKELSGGGIRTLFNCN